MPTRTASVVLLSSHYCAIPRLLVILLVRCRMCGEMPDGQMGNHHSHYWLLLGQLIATQVVFLSPRALCFVDGRLYWKCHPRVMLTINGTMNDCPLTYVFLMMVIRKKQGEGDASESEALTFRTHSWNCVFVRQTAKASRGNV